MKKIKKSKTFKLVSWLLVFLFIFQSDYLFSQPQEMKSDFEIQFELAKKEFDAGKFNSAKKRLERLILALNKNIEKEKRLLEKANSLLDANREKLEPKSIEIRKKMQPISENMIEREGEKKKKKFPWMLVIGGVVVVGVVVYFLALRPKKSTLNVTRGEGVEGNPDSGSYKYKKGETVNYFYSLQSGYSNLIVQLDGSEVSSSGTVEMNGNHTLTANAGANVVTFVTDKDEVTIEEGKTANFQVWLSAQPTSDVDVTVSRDSGDTDISVKSGSNLIFTTENWQTPQTVEFEAAEDTDRENGQAAILISANNVNGIADKTITATEQDNDFLRFVTDTESVTIPEGRTNSFNVKLSSQPVSDIQATVTRISGDSDITVKSGQNLTFTTTNWDNDQTVTLRAANDDDTDNGEATIRISASGVSDKDITATEVDDDAAGCTISVSISSPANNAAVSDEITIRVSVSGTCLIDRVEFFVDGGAIHADTASPYTANWDTTTYFEGSHTIRVVAYSTTGKTANHQITVTVTR